MPQAQKIALVILTWNAEKDIPALFNGIMQQTLMPQPILVIDSSSKDKTQEMVRQYPVTLHVIDQKEFDHGGTRKLATQMIDADIYIFMTQDAIPADPNTFANIVTALSQDEKIGCAYGRQLPKADATFLAAYDRSFNYPVQSQIRSYAEKDKYGFKTFFNSNSFAAYKKEALNKVGGFPSKLITSEDAYVAAKMLLAGYKVCYAADANVLHSHNMSLREKFHRYFSTGVFHSKENWIIQSFSGAESEGMRYLKNQIQYLQQHNKAYLIPYVFLSVGVSYFAYKLGRNERFIPLAIKKKWGINKKYWLS